MKGYILAHDLGTSGNKATLYGVDGTLAASALAEYPTAYPGPGCAEQDTEDWWRAVCTATRELLEKSGAAPKDILCLSFSGQMMGCLLVDREGKPLRPALIWADTRAGKQEREMTKRLGMERVYRLTGHRLSASYSAAKLLWVREREPEVYKRARKLLQAKDYMVYRLTGRFATDYSDASGTNLFDIQRKCWSEEILDAFGIPAGMLPEAFPSATAAGGLLPQAAAETGLLAGTPVVLGGGDGSCACVGAGAVDEGSSYCVLGSSAWISFARRSPVFDPEMRTFNWVHLDPELVTPCGTMQAAGLSYNWYRSTLCTGEAAEARDAGESVYARIDRGAAASAPGAGGVMYLPYLLGERSPRWDHDARGAFLGLSASTAKGDMSRAVLEGVGMNLKIILDILERDCPAETLTVIGGGARGDVWLQILADIWQKELEVPADPEGASSMGAAVCAGVGVGIYDNYAAVERFRKPGRVFRPDPALGDFYRRRMEIFNRAYEALRDVSRLLVREEGGQR